MPVFTVCFSSLNEVTFSARFCFTWGRFFNDYIKMGGRGQAQVKVKPQIM